MQILSCDQGTEDWFTSRLGIVTMSKLSALLVNGKSQSGLGKDAFSYMNQLIGERMTGELADDFVGNRHTERGNEYDPIARSLYEQRTGNVVDNVGIILNHGAGYSPDGIVGDDGCIEIKSKLPKYLCQVILDGEIPKEHIAQCQGGLWVSEREWIDFIAYWPGMPLFVKRAYRDEVLIKQISERVSMFYEELDKRLDKIMNAAA